MKIKKILNNNSVLVGEGTKDFIWIGTGLGFKMKPGQMADESKVERVFVLQKQSSDRLMNLLQDIPIKYITTADDIIKYGKQYLSYNLSDSIYISLTDHIFNSIRLHKEGLQIQNQLFWEIRKFYPKEFAIGEYSIQFLNQKFSVELDESEASNIAMHFINAQLNNDEQVENIQLLTQKIHDIIAIIRMHNQVDVDENSLAFERLVTHLRFFFKRIENRPTENPSNPLLVHVIEKYPDAYETTLLIGKYLEKDLIDEEQLYLTLHVQKLVEE